MMEKLKICMLKPAAFPPNTDIFPTVIHSIPWQGAPWDQRYMEVKGLRKKLPMTQQCALAAS